MVLQPSDVTELELNDGLILSGDRDGAGLDIAPYTANIPGVSKAYRPAL